MPKKAKDDSELEYVEDSVDASDEVMDNKKIVLNKNGKYILVIVESPGKIKKLEDILGKEYKVASSYGHIMDLYGNKLSVDIENNFTPEYTIITDKDNKFKDKHKVVKELKEMASKAKDVILAADKDREGEMIAWSLMTQLGLTNPKRITFNAITKNEIMEAIKKPGLIDMKMVESQKARRILDRLVGFKISPELDTILGMKKLSAGRVQSIVVRLIVDKENEIKDFFQKEDSSYFKFSGSFDSDGNELKADLYTTKKNEIQLDKDEADENKDVDENMEGISDEEDEKENTNKKKKGGKAKIVSHSKAKTLMNDMTKSKFKIGSLTKRESIRYPPPPHTTSTAQQDASSKLGFSVKRTMQALQNLYEAGLTTYLRTDSTNLSKEALDDCEKYIKDTFGKEYSNKKNYTSKKGNTQEAHEAIRPTKISTKFVEPKGKIGNDEIRMYNLVWKRTVASQMSASKVDVYTIEINISKLDDYYFVSTQEDITFPGFLKVYGIGAHGAMANEVDEVSSENKLDNTDDTDDSNLERSKKKNKIKTSKNKKGGFGKVNLPKTGEILKVNNIKAVQEYAKPPLRYSEAGLIRKLDPKNLNIGRPATYAEIINTIQKRKYVIVGDTNGTEKESYTLSWNGKETNPKIEEDIKKIYLGKETKKFIPTELGMTVNDILVKHFPQIMEYKFTSDMEDNLDKIAEGKLKWVKVLQEFWNKLEPLLENVKNVKKTEKVIGKDPVTNNDIIATMGQYGPMLKVKVKTSDKGKDTYKYAPIKEPYTIDTITLKDAIEVLKYPKLLGEYKKKDVELKTGKNGFYVTWGKIGVNLDIDDDPDDITLDKAIELITKKQEDSEKKKEAYIYYNKDGTTEYIINKGQYGKYIMIKDTKKKTAKPIFYNVPDSVDTSNLTFEKVKELIDEAKTRKYKKPIKTEDTKKTGGEKKTKDPKVKIPKIKIDIKKKKTTGKGKGKGKGKTNIKDLDLGNNTVNNLAFNIFKTTKKK